MKWEEHLKHRSPAKDRRENEEQLYRMCLLAYAEGCSEEKKKALEAYRLRCGRLFGNRCMPPVAGRADRKKICDAHCSYIKKYEFELYKLGGCVEDSPE